LIAIKETHLGQHIDGQKALKLELKNTQKRINRERWKNTAPVKTLTTASTLRIYHIFCIAHFWTQFFFKIFVQMFFKSTKVSK